MAEQLKLKRTFYLGLELNKTLHACLRMQIRYRLVKMKGRGGQFGERFALGLLLGVLPSLSTRRTIYFYNW
jgi:hypothetical protein